MLAPSLYRALMQRFGQVRIVSEGQKRLASFRNGKEDIQQYGESFNVCCPFCGDGKFRLSVGYTWLTRDPTGKRHVDRIHCYNEHCREPYGEAFWRPFAEAIDRGASVDRMAELLAPPPPPPEPIRLPVGCQPLQSLAADHPAFAFLARQYPRVPLEDFLAAGVQFTDQYDERWRMAANRVIFPIVQDQALQWWQGRTINPLETRLRWLNPGGFHKALFRHDDVPADHTVVITEGITSAMGTHPDAVATYGCNLTGFQLDSLAKRWRRAIVATDPDTFVPDHRVRGQPRIAAQELMEKLRPRMEAVSPIEWPADLLEVAARKVGPDHATNKDLRVPDAADLGRAFMLPLIEGARSRLCG